MINGRGVMVSSMKKNYENNADTKKDTEHCEEHREKNPMQSYRTNLVQSANSSFDRCFVTVIVRVSEKIPI